MSLQHLNSENSQNNFLGVVQCRMNYLGFCNKSVLFITLLRLYKFQKSFITVSSNPTLKFPTKGNVHNCRKIDQCFYLIPQHYVTFIRIVRKTYPVGIYTFKVNNRVSHYQPLLLSHIEPFHKRIFGKNQFSQNIFANK